MTVTGDEPMLVADEGAASAGLLLVRVLVAHVDARLRRLRLERLAELVAPHAAEEDAHLRLAQQPLEEQS